MYLHPAKVLVATPPTYQVQLLDTGRVLANVVQPTITGSLLGYLFIPAVGDRVIVTYWADATPFILCGLSAWSQQIASIPTGQPHEQFIYGPHGQVLAQYVGGDMDLTAPNGIVRLATSGGAAVARVGDSVSVSLSTGNGTITGGSAKVTAG